MKHAITLLAALLLAPLAALQAADPAAASKPNIVFIFADDWGWGFVVPRAFVAEDAES